ncbi:MAG: 30S ribosomal protein S6 [Candidatus Pacebacteria bacterium]|nr:30S ribosomal protein S6 [Candidatus Paceibacterota bacterium]MBP9701218.1 30S ribosomal protein S6 [Candidatus Paceibacterota bacterium]
MTEEANTRLYELGYLITPTTPEVEVGGEVDTLKAAITKIDGTVTSEGAPEFIDLAYTMEKTVGSKKSKYAQGYFGWIKFDADPAALVALKKVLDGNLALIRYILVKTNVENTVVFKKPKVDAKRDVFMSEEELAELESATEEVVEEVKDEHEKLPELDIDTPAAPVASEPEEKEEL